MNNFIKHILFVIFFVAVSFSSCRGIDDFLEKPPGVDITEDTIFSTKKDIETFLFAAYAYGMHSYYPYNEINGGKNPNPSFCISAAMTDEAEMADTWFSAQQWNVAAIESQYSWEDERIDMRYGAIRRCNILLERLPDAIDFQEKDQFIGEALFIRALNNFEILKRYGAMPIVKKRFLVSDDIKLPRATLEEYVNFIVEDCDEAARLLKGVQYTANQRGRVTHVAALALKSKTLLYAASPLFNTATPYMDGEAKMHICYGNYDKQRWKEAADAALAVINSAPSYGFALLNNGDPENDYRKVWEEHDNKEIILAEKVAKDCGGWEDPWRLIMPQPMNMHGWAGVCVPHNFIRKYEKMNGESQTWNEPGVWGTDLMEKYAELDPRFRQTVAYNGSEWCLERPEMQLYEGGEHNTNKNVTGAFMHKTIPYIYFSWHTPNGILFRVAEAYLNYAEALNEYLDHPSEQVYWAINMIRERAGMPDLPSGIDQSEMRERIKNERDIELAFEDHRMWDIRRWMDAEKDGVMQGSFYKVNIKRISGSKLESKCDYMISEYEKRTFKRRMYLHPILENEINKGYLVQNPGW